MSTVKSHIEGTTLIMERLFKAPRQLVFEAFSTPAHLEKWWGPSGWETKVYSFDFKPGGIWHYCMTCVDKEQGVFYGMESWGKSTFIDIDPYSQNRLYGCILGCGRTRQSGLACHDDHK